jgi:hypothetical protein
MESRFKVNDWVICTREKYGLSPGKRAKNITPAPHGDLYSYEVDKYWIVREISETELILETRTGKQHVVPLTDRRVRLATWWERWLYKGRFPSKSTNATRAPSPKITTSNPSLPRSA